MRVWYAGGRRSARSTAQLLLAGSAGSLWVRYPRCHCESTKPSAGVLADTSSLPNSSPSDHGTHANNGEGTELSYFEDEEKAAWANFSRRFEEARASISAIQWEVLGDKITDQVVPKWAQALPGYIARLQGEMAMRPDSLAAEIWTDAQDSNVHPEIGYPARVRSGTDLCPEELAFLKLRKKRTTEALARYLNVSESEIDSRDVPTIAVCSSGGGLRALVAGASSYLSAQQAGLLDCATYTAGVSGSCWLQTMYHSSIGRQNYETVIEHLKKRIGVHIAYPPVFLELVTKAPTNKYLLSGIVEKIKGDPKADFGLVDVYGLLLATRLMVPRDELSVDQRDLKLSNQRAYLQNGAHPMPIYTAVRHEIPIKEEKAEGRSPEKAGRKAKERAWFQWFEFSPYEMWSQDFQLGIPTWSIGRHFKNGLTETRESGLGLPEIRIPFMMGMWGSAFCATLAHYYKEIRPLVKGLAGFGGVDDLMSEKNDELSRLHPIDPGVMPNFALDLKSSLPPDSPKSILTGQYLELMDAGMSNNLPIYPLLRPARDIDIIVCFDSSADVKQENWLSVVDEYARQHRIKQWPLRSGWPKQSSREVQLSTQLSAADATTATKQVKDDDQQQTPSSSPPTKPSPSSTPSTPDLTYCNIFLSHPSPLPTSPHPVPGTRILSIPSSSFSPLCSPTSGTTVIYFPFLPNPAKAPGIDPATSDFLSTWNFIYTPDQIDSVVGLAKANFEEGREMTREAVRAVWERKKGMRLEREERGS